jgi:hypothetical protein
MKFSNQPSTCYGIKQSESEYEGKKFSSTTFYLPADLAANANGKTLGVVTVPYKCGDATEFDKWAHLSKSWPLTGGIPVLADFEMVAGRDAQGRDSGKLVLTGIRPAPTTPRA